MLRGFIAILDSQAWPFVVFLSAVFAILITNLIFVKVLRTSQSRPQVKVSILVPARNEEINIERCVCSLLAQEGVDFELIVLDDGSTDGTYDMLSRLAAADKRLTVIRGSGPEAGWTGKNYACWKLANESSGDVLLFTDADTFHEPGSAASAACAIRESGAGLLSGMVRQEAGTLGELLLVPLMNWALLCFMPAALSQGTKAPFLSVACGQYMVFDRQAYFAIGGHDAVKGQIVEDMELARTMKAHGRKALLLDATDVVRCRMYRGLGDAVKGFTKNLFGIFRYSIFVTVFIWTWLFLAVIHPFVYIAFSFASESRGVGLPALVSLALSLCIWLIAYAKSRIPIHMVLLYPLSITLWMLLAFKSMLATLLGTSTWKSRQLPRPKIKLL